MLSAAHPAILSTAAEAWGGTLSLWPLWGGGVCDFLSEHPAPKLRQQDKPASLSLSLLICRVGTLMRATVERCSARFSWTNLFRSHDIPKMWGLVLSPFHLAFYCSC